VRIASAVSARLTAVVETTGRLRRYRG